jgi:hypothetical protein
MIIFKVYIEGILPVESKGNSPVTATADLYEAFFRGSTTGARRSDVVDTYPDGTSFCTPSKPPHHGFLYYNGTEVRYAFIGDAARCPSTAASQFSGPGNTSSSPNGNIAADAMASSLAHVLDTMLTDPIGTAWFDRYGLENADKCTGTFGQTYITANGARANMKLGSRDYLIQQNWVNGRRSNCGLSL